MNLQTAFYTLAIIFMVLSIVLLIGIGVLIFYIKKTVDHIHFTIDEKIEYFTKMTSVPAEIASGIGAAVARGIKNFARRR